MIWPILKALLEDIAYYYGGPVVLGAGVGFAASRGPGIVPGAVAGHYIGITLLNILGFKAIAETIIPRLPEIARGYAKGFSMAWGPRTEVIMSVVPTDINHLEINVTGAAHKMATAHVAFVIVLLLSLWQWLTRAKGSQRLEVLAQISNNKRLGPTMARWLEKHEKQLENVYRSEMGSHSGGTRSAPETVTTTPSQARAAEAKTASAKQKKGKIDIEEGAKPNANEERAGKGLADEGYDVTFQKTANDAGISGVQTADMRVEGVGQVDVYSPLPNTRQDSIVNTIVGKHRQANSILTQTDLPYNEVVTIKNRVFGNLGAKEITTLFFQDSKNNIIRFDKGL